MILLLLHKIFKKVRFSLADETFITATPLLDLNSNASSLLPVLSSSILGVSNQPLVGHAYGCLLGDEPFYIGYIYVE